MAYGEFEGMTSESPEIRDLFDREKIIESDWYQKRLDAAKHVRRSLWQRHVEYLDRFTKKPLYEGELGRLDVHEKLQRAKDHLASLANDRDTTGTIGTDPALVDFTNNETSQQLENAAS